jgi:predicted regulator of Ras-like GTPase activity (Roadblock/LC7/MglB family)
VSAPAFQAILREVMRLRGVRGALLADARDGIPIATALDVDVDGDAVAALAVSLYGHAERAVAAAGYGRSTFFQLQAEAGWLCVVSSGAFVLAAVAEPRVNVALLRLRLLQARAALPA